ncbi:MAG: 50S ribosomal protein L18 [bacterium]|nr:50S ribosomal protein L18 [bacterium]
MANNAARNKRHRRVRAKVSGTAERPRLAVYRSNTGIYAQLIDDIARKTIAGVSPKELKDTKIAKVELSKLLGELIAKKAKEAKVETIVFDRGGYQYHGRIKAFAEAVREAGLKF